MYVAFSTFKFRMVKNYYTLFTIILFLTICVRCLFIDLLSSSLVVEACMHSVPLLFLT